MGRDAGFTRGTPFFQPRLCFMGFCKAWGGRKFLRIIEHTYAAPLCKHDRDLSSNTHMVQTMQHWILMPWSLDKNSYKRRGISSMAECCLCNRKVQVSRFVSTSQPTRLKVLASWVKIGKERHPTALPRARNAYSSTGIPGLFSKMKYP